MLFNVETADILSLNATARAIWEAIAEPVTIATVCETLQRRFVVDAAACLQDVAAALNEFERRGFVRITPPAEFADSR
ncbi:MAG TPA: PqqD family protein [Steroidobacteraceae bacterium]|nr:PqqD family protein [Steroidobacteraceae bacterium]